MNDGSALNKGSCQHALPCPRPMVSIIRVSSVGQCLRTITFYYLISCYPGGTLAHILDILEAQEVMAPIIDAMWPGDQRTQYVA